MTLPTPVAEPFAARFGRLREQAGLTKTALAGDRYTVSYVSQIESGRRRPSPAALAWFANRLGADEQYLGTGIPEGTQDRLAVEVEHARFGVQRGNVEESYQAARSLIDEAENYGLTRIRAQALSVAGYGLFRLGRIREAIDRYEEALEDGLSERDRGTATAALARLYASVGDLTYAAELVESFLQRSGPSPLDPSVGADLHSTLVSVYFERGDVTRAERAAVLALAATEQGVEPRARAGALWNASRVFAEAKRWNEALDMATRARMIIEELDDRRRLAGVHNAYASLCLEVDPPKLKEANKHLLVSENLFREIGTPADLAHVYVEQGRLALLEDRAADALEYSERALLHTDDDPLERGRCLLVRGRALARLRRPEAKDSFEEAAAVFRKLGSRQQEASCWREIGDIEFQAGELEAAVTSLRAGLDALDPHRSRA